MSEPRNEETIFARARGLPRPERAGYLEDACGADPRLRQAVEALLEADEAAGTFLGESAVTLRRKEATIPAEKQGDRIGRYKLLEQIGEGGCGVVYVAEQQEDVRRRVALKVIKSGMDTKGVVARFEAERQALALMDHPNIAKVLDAGATELGRPFFVMELVRGTKITDFCDEHRLSPRQRLELAIQVCRAVQHAHQKGIIHRDLKPSNILVTLHDGVPVPKVIDFGIAKATQGRLTDHTVYTAFEQFMGTPAYMSPEQAEMSGLDVDTRSDIYSLGVLLYELLTGKTPFDAEQLLKAGLDEMRRTILLKEPLRPSTRLSALFKGDLSTTASQRQTDPPKLIHIVRGDLDWIVMKCLEKDRSRRYETANGMAMDISRYLNNEPIVARPPSRLYRIQKLARRNRGGLVVVCTVVIAVLVALVILSVSNVRISRERDQKDVALRERRAALEAARASERNAKEQLVHALRNQAQARRFSRQMGQRFDSLAALSQAARMGSSEGLRDEAIASMALPDVRRGTKWETLTTSVASAFDSDYTRYARVDPQGVITICSIPDNRELLRLGSSDAPVPCANGCAMLFSQDGRFLAVRDENLRLHVWRLADGKVLLPEVSLKCWGFAFSPEGQKLVVGLTDSIVCFDVNREKEISRWAASGQPYSLAFDHYGQRLAVGYLDSNEVSIYSVTNGALEATLPVGASREEIVAWHPDGQHLATSGSDPRVQIWDVQAKQKVATLEGNVQQVTFLSFHPGGELIASGGWEGVVRFWEPASAREVIKLPFGALFGLSKGAPWLGVAWEDGRTAQLFEASPSQEYHTFVARPTPQNILYQGEISLEGRLLVMGMDDGVHLWDLSRRVEVGFLPIGTTLSVGFQKEGRELVTCGPDAGLQRWSIRKEDDSQNVLRVGPPVRIPLPFTPMRAVQVENGSIAAVASEQDGKSMVLDLEKGTIAGADLPHEGVCFLALSKNGHWVATSGWHSNLLRLWEVGTSKLVHEWNLRGPLVVCFTPNDEELIICRDGEFDFVNLRTLSIGRTIRREIGVYPGHVAFSPDGQLMAMEMKPGVVHLKEASTGRTVAKLEDPFGDRATWMSFTPGGCELVVAARYAGAIHVWDLRGLRVRLKAMGLDWDWPEFPEAVGVHATLPPGFPALKVQIASAAAR